MFGAVKRDKAFKDYCLILQVHPEADAAMVDAAYWHLARRYNQAATYDSQARAKLEELNEAYIVLGSAERREEYMKVRAGVLGEGTLPQAPNPAPEKPPLTVMSRQRPQERTAAADPGGERRRRPFIRVILGAALLLGAASAALAAVVALQINASVAAAAATIAILAVAAIAAGFQGPRGARGARASQLSRQATRAARPSNDDRPVGDQLNKAREAELPGPASFTAPTDFQGAATELAEAATPKPLGRDQLEEIRRQAAHFRRIAKSSEEVVLDASKGDTDGTSEDLDKVRQQTERLKAIAAKFNAAKARTSSQPSQDESKTTQDN